MDKAYNPQSVEESIYKMWETGGYFSPNIDPKKEPFSILLPPPNANADLHVGHAMYVVEDILIRYRRMKGDPTLWMPGADHAGFETQYVYEKHLAKQGKSRFDFDRETLYKDIWNFVHANRGSMENQLRRLGFSLDWGRNVFTLDPKIIATVYQTFKKLYDDGLIYRGLRLINYCTRCGTGFSDLEVKHVEQTDPLYYLKYGPFVLATVRPETKFGDTAVAVNPNDKRYKQWIGKDIEVEGLLGTFTIKVIADNEIDPSFGTGVAKVTPTHDMKDFEIWKRHKEEMPEPKLVIGFDGRLTDIAGPYARMKVKAARIKIADDMNEKGLMDHTDEKYTHTVATCYKCGTTLEPLPLSQWFIKIRPLADAAIDSIKKKTVVFVPKRFEKHAIQWLTDFHDWNISRQITWGIQIPAWYCLDCDANSIFLELKAPLHDKTISATWSYFKRKMDIYKIKSYKDLESQVKSIKISENAHPIVHTDTPTMCPRCKSNNLIREQDTFDTWFSSGQWPFATVQATGDYDYFYPISVMETGYDILPWWVCRMLMLGIHLTGQVPFKTVYLHGLVRDAQGQKMSKSKGNVINPLKMVDQYGADALRMALVFGAGAGNDQALSEDKIRGMRNFTNKLWNIARFIELTMQQSNNTTMQQLPFYDEAMHTQLKNSSDKQIISEVHMLAAGVTRDIDRYRFSDAAQKIYDFAWHTLADVHLEKNKERFKTGDAQALAVLRHVFLTILKLTHPFMPFVTEEIWGKIPRKTTDPLIISPWPDLSSPT